MTLKERIQAAMAANPDDNQLEILVTGLSEAVKALKAAPSPKRAKAAQDLEALLAQYLDKLDGVGSPWPTHFENPNQVFDYLKQAHPARKVSRQTVNNHWGTVRLPVDASGVCLRRTADSYAEKRPLRPGSPVETAAPPTTGEATALADDFMMERIRLVREQRIKEARKNDKEAGKLIPKSVHVPAIIAAIHVVERNVRTRIKKASRAAVDACGGDAARRQALVVVLNSAVDDALRVVKDTEQFQVMFAEWGEE